MTVGGGSGANLTMQVKLIVEPLLMCSSGPPTTSVTGSALKNIQVNIKVKNVEIIKNITIGCYRLHRDRSRFGFFPLDK